MPEKSKELFEHLAEVLEQLPEEAAVNALSHATARAEGIQTGLEMAKNQTPENTEGDAVNADPD